MKVAAYQAPFPVFGSFAGVALVAEQIAVCADRGVDLLCCPEGILGGVALESEGQDPGAVALGVADGQLAEVVAPWLGSTVTVVAGFTERDEQGRLFAAAAIVAPDGIRGVYRKVFPGYRTAIHAGTELPVVEIRGAAVGIVICNDLWYPEPARVLGARGAAIILAPSNSGHVRAASSAGPLRARARSLPIARAVDSCTTVVVADVVGRQGDRSALGGSVIVDPDGAVIAAAPADAPALLVADVEPTRRTSSDPRGWDGATNPAVTDAYLALWTGPPR